MHLCSEKMPEKRHFSISGVSPIGSLNFMDRRMLKVLVKLRIQKVQKEVLAEKDKRRDLEEQLAEDRKHIPPQQPSLNRTVLSTPGKESMSSLRDASTMTVKTTSPLFRRTQSASSLRRRLPAAASQKSKCGVGHKDPGPPLKRTHTPHWRSTAGLATKRALKDNHLDGIDYVFHSHIPSVRTVRATQRNFSMI